MVSQHLAQHSCRSKPIKLCTIAKKLLFKESTQSNILKKYYFPQNTWIFGILLHLRDFEVFYLWKSTGPIGPALQWRGLNCHKKSPNFEHFFRHEVVFITTTAQCIFVIQYCPIGCQFYWFIFHFLLKISCSWCILCILFTLHMSLS